MLLSRALVPLRLAGFAASQSAASSSMVMSPARGSVQCPRRMATRWASWNASASLLVKKVRL